MCRKHNVLFTMERMERCDEITGCTNIWRFARKLKEQNIRNWDVEERKQAIIEFASLTIQMKNFQESKQAQLV
jgi:DNA polymerase III delta subunit